MHLYILFNEKRERGQKFDAQKSTQQTRINEYGKKAQTVEQLIICWQQRNCVQMQERMWSQASIFSSYSIGFLIFWWFCRL